MTDNIENIPENKSFWNELCGNNMFLFIGLTEVTPDSLIKFDQHYFNYYPYLKRHVSEDKIKNKKILEIGLGFGTLSEYIFSHAAEYVGVDYAENPVKMVNERAKMRGFASTALAVNGDARNLKFEDESFDTVVSIGCFHHTGDTEGSVKEAYRVLKKGGQAVIMLYNKNSFRKFVSNPYRYFVKKRRKVYKSFDEYTRASYDANAGGDAAPVVDQYSKPEVRKMFSDFKRVKVKTENFDSYYVSLFNKKRYVPREWFLNNFAKIMGLDLYILAKK